ncbi:MAG: PIN domain-containing protein [Spirochaetia bacterium]|jgi:predicted nucleic acid-binding protein|nr:PIN domain-containing protein [Spirochaetia bacterium]
MILVDTSALIDYFKGIDSRPAALFETLMVHGVPYGICDSAYQELLQGSGTLDEFATLKDYLETISFHDLQHGKESYERAALLNSQCRRTGVTVRSMIDLLIAESAIENNLLLLHNDGDFDTMSRVTKDLGIYGV